MKPVALLISLGLMLSVPFSTAAEPLTSVEPFEPALSECFDASDKFRQPRLLVVPKIAFPFERRSGPQPHVVVLVQIDETGVPKRLAILSSSGEAYSRAALEGLKQARWQPHTRKSVWFYFTVTFSIP